MSTATAAGPEIVLPDVEMNIYKPTEPVKVKIHKNDLCTEKKAAGYVRHVEFDVSGTNLVGKCFPGQAMGVLVPKGTTNATTGKPEFNKVRLYSISSPAGGDDASGRHVSVSVKRTISEHWENNKLFLGLASNYLCDRQPGDEVWVSGPNGKRFLLPVKADEHDYIFFATGTGIAPFRGMLIDLFRRKAKSKIVLIMGSPYQSDLLYHEFFLRMQQENPNFTYITAISREMVDGHKNLYIQDRLRTNRDQLLPVLANRRTLLYMCGLAGMELGIFQQLALQLNGDDLAQYLECDRAALADIRKWNRQMIFKQVKPTRRVLMEVYA